MKTRKLLAVLLACAMTLGCAVPTMANTASSSGTDKISNATGSKTIDVDAVLKKTASDDPDPVYAATITWSAGTITGTLKKQTYTWDAENTKYVADSAYKHELESTAVNTPVSIKVTNRSNASIYYSITEKDLSTDYTLTHSAASTNVAETEITAADLVSSNGSSTGTTARAAMKAGNTDSTLTGKGIDSAEYKDTVTLTGTTKTMATAATDVAEYVISIQTSVIKLVGADTVLIGGTTTLAASALFDGIGKPGTDGTLTWESSDATVMTVADGVVTPASEAKSGDKATITATYTNNGKTYTASKVLTIVKVQYTAQHEDAFTESEIHSVELSANALLASSTVSYDDDDDDETAEAVAYNGYISATKYASWYDAFNFVSELNGSATWGGSTHTLSTNAGTAYTLTNTTKIVPTGQTSGEWRLLSYEEVESWADETPGATSGFGGVRWYWELNDNPYTFGYISEILLCESSNKDDSYSYLGFVVVWDPN